MSASPPRMRGIAARRLGSLGLALLGAVTAREARAQEGPPAPPPTAPAAPEVSDQDDAAMPAAPAAASTFHFDLAAHGEYLSAPIAGGVSPFGLGAGGSLGLVLSHVYVGANVTAFLGSKDDAGTSERALLYGGELGYEIRLAPWLTLRPFIGAGGATITHSLQNASTTASPAITGSNRRSSAVDVITQATSSSGGGSSSASTTDTTASAGYVEPGVLGMLTSSSGTYVGLGVSILYLPSVPYDTDSSVSWRSFKAFARVGQIF